MNMRNNQNHNRNILCIVYSILNHFPILYNYRYQNLPNNKKHHNLNNNCLGMGNKGLRFQHSDHLKAYN